MSGSGDISVANEFKKSDIPMEALDYFREFDIRVDVLDGLLSVSKLYCLSSIVLRTQNVVYRAEKSSQSR